MSEVKESNGRIEVAPSVLTSIARLSALKVEGVRALAAPPTEMLRLFRRATRQDGVVLHLDEGQLTFDIYVLMNPQVNIMETSRQLQAAIVEAIDKMVGVPVSKVNIHVEDVVYSPEETD